MGTLRFSNIIILKIYCMPWKILVLLIIQICAEEWYQPNSHIISDTQFTELVQNDKSTYKLIKFFTPHCVYCRYLKTAIDTLKAQKQWNFQIYDFNCAVYPQKCFELGVTAYPYVIVFDKNGTKEDHLLGFYPLPVLQQFFNKIQLKNSHIPQQQDQKPPISQEIVQNKAQQVIKSQEALANKLKQHIATQIVSNQDAKPNPHEMIHTVIKHIEENQPGLPKQEANKPIHLQGYSQDIFFCLCILLGVAYFSNISYHFIKKTVKSSKKQNSNPQLKDEIGAYNKKQASSISPI